MINIKNLNKKQINSICDFINDLIGTVHSIEYQELSEDDELFDFFSTDIHYHYNLLVANNKYLGISCPNINQENTITLIKWLEEHGLNNNVLSISSTFSSTTYLHLLPNLVNISLAFSKEEDKYVTLNYLNGIHIKKTNISTNLNSIKFDRTLIRSLNLSMLTGDVDIDEINSFVNLKYLDVLDCNIENNNSKKIKLLKLNQFSSSRAFSINLISDCKNLRYIAGNIDTSIDHSNLKNNIYSITNIGNTSNNVLDLNNVYSEKLERLAVYNSELKVNKKCENILHLDIAIHKNYFDRIKKIDFKTFNISKLSFFPKIENLSIHGIDIVDDIKTEIQFNSLKKITIRASDTSDINFLAKIPNLEKLHLTHCKIENIEVLEQLNNLKEVNLSNNKIIGIPPILSKRFNITAITHEDSLLNLVIGNNPLISPPIEIVERGESAVRPYFDSMVGEMEELNEAKIIFLGNGEVGKTSLMKALSGQAFNTEEATTHGINICRYNVPINDQRTIDASIWDFGGQQIMHATHQLFLSRRCVYVLVINDRRDDLQQEQKIEYWLQQVQTFGSDSKVIIIRNKSDMFSLNNVPEGKLKEKFTNLVAIEPVSCKTADNIDRVRNLINEQVRQLPMRKVCLAKNWIKIKEEIKALSHEKDHLPLSTYTDICVKNGVTDYEAQNTLRQLLHDLSVIIAFEELSDFDMGILNPHWITDGIYTIINSDVLEGNKGYIKISEVQQELDRVHPNKYKNKARFIIESMMHFELCHSIGNSKSNTYLVPNLLPNEVRDHSITQEKNTIRFLFKYENLLPPSLFPKLLVRMNNQIAADKRWRTGAIMTDVHLDVQARVEVDSVAKEITILVSGEQTRDFFSIIRHNIKNLNNPSAEALGVRELVPLDDSGEYIDYEELIGLEVMGQTDYISGKLKRNYPVSRLLNGIESRVETERSVARQREDIKVSVEVKTGDVNVTTGHITNTLTSSNEQTQTANQSQNIDITIELKGLKGTAKYVLEDLKDEAETEIENERDRIRFIKECDKVQTAIEHIEHVDTPEIANENLGYFSRIRDFLSSALEGTGNVGDAMQSLGDNISKVRELARKYNKVASFLGIPIVPEILL